MAVILIQVTDHGDKNQTSRDGSRSGCGALCAGPKGGSAVGREVAGGDMHAADCLSAKVGGRLIQ